MHIHGKLTWKVRPLKLVSETRSGALRGGAVIIQLHTSAEYEAPAAITRGDLPPETLRLLKDWSCRVDGKSRDIVSMQGGL